MAYYAYKRVQQLIPQHIIDKQGKNYNGDPSYDGDLWDAAADYIEELEKKLKDSGKSISDKDLLMTALNLPVITEDQVICCENGCGECRPVVTEFEILSEKDRFGNLISKVIKHEWVSDCCKAQLLVWDKKNDDFVDLFTVSA
jgi:hypothetical protein